MTVALRWAESSSTDGVVTHPFSLLRSPVAVPGVAWYAAAADASKRPLVLLGHGGSSHKCSARNVRLATSLVRDFKINAAAIDGPFHGDRPPAPGVDYQSALVEEGVDVVTDRVVSEWLDVVQALSNHPRLAHDSLGYLGLSMGSRFGVPVAARLNGRLAVAVLGKFGVRDSGVLHPGHQSPARILEAAHRVSAPVLFHAERFDEVFPLDDQVALFDAFGTTNKSMLVSEGTHGTQRSEDELTWLEFLDYHLRTCL